MSQLDQDKAIVVLLTPKHIQLILSKIHPGGFGYSEDPEVGVIQVALSIAMEAAARRQKAVHDPR